MVEKGVEVPQMQEVVRHVSVPVPQIEEVIMHVPRVETVEIVANVPCIAIQTVERVEEVVHTHRKSSDTLTCQCPRFRKSSGVGRSTCRVESRSAVELLQKHPVEKAVRVSRLVQL